MTIPAGASEGTPDARVRVVGSAKVLATAAGAEQRSDWWVYPIDPAANSFTVHDRTRRGVDTRRVVRFD